MLRVFPTVMRQRCLQSAFMTPWLKRAVLFSCFFSHSDIIAGSLNYVSFRCRRSVECLSGVSPHHFGMRHVTLVELCLSGIGPGGLKTGSSTRPRDECGGCENDIEDKSVPSFWLHRCVTSVILQSVQVGRIIWKLLPPDLEKSLSWWKLSYYTFFLFV